jgi:hypothetical protein
MARNVDDLCITAYVLSLKGRNEIRAREAVFTIADVYSREDQHEEHRDSARPPDSFDIDHYPLDRDQSAVPDDSSSDEEPAEEALETDFDPIEEVEEFLSYQRLHAELFEVGDIEQMFEYPLYLGLMSKVDTDRCIESLAQKLDMLPDQSIQSLHNWIEMPAEMLRFSLLGDRSPDTIWRSAHQYNEWQDFSRLAVRVITLGTSEADVQRIISAHQDLASLKGTRYSDRHFEVACNFVSAGDDKMEPEKTKR